MMPQVASVEVARTLRSERVAALTEQLKANAFDAVRYESTPRRRAERLAQVLCRSLSRGALRRRLRKLGVAPEFCGGDLLAISVEGGGLDVRRVDGKGQVVTGPGLDAALLGAFPELVPFTLRNSDFIATGGFTPGSGVENISAPFNITRNLSLSGTESWNLSGVSSFWEIIKAEVDLVAFAGGFTPFNGSYGAPLIDVDADFPFASYHWDTVPPITGQECARNDEQRIEWPIAGRVWIHDNAGDNSADTGAWTWTGTLLPVEGGCPTEFPPPAFWFAGGGNGGFLYITYDAGPCSECSLDLQVNSSCDGNIVDGGVFSLEGVYECTQVDGTCTISGITPGTYSWTWTKTGYQSQSGTYECECEGGSSTLFLDVTPEGGCSGTCTFEVNVTNYCDGDELEGVTVNVTGPGGYDEDCVTGADGICEFQNLAHGDYSITISKSGWQGPTVLTRNCPDG